MGNSPSLPPPPSPYTSQYRISPSELSLLQASLSKGDLSPSAVVGGLFEGVEGAGAEFLAEFQKIAFPPSPEGADPLENYARLYSYILRPSRKPFSSPSPSSFLDLIISASSSLSAAPSLPLTILSSLAALTLSPPPDFPLLPSYNLHLTSLPPTDLQSLSTPDKILGYIDAHLPLLHLSISSHLPLPSVRPRTPPRKAEGGGEMDLGFALFVAMSVGEFCES